MNDELLRIVFAGTWRGLSTDDPPTVGRENEFRRTGGARPTNGASPTETEHTERTLARILVEILS